MPDETTAPVEQAVDSEKENLKAELDAMRKKNAELLDSLFRNQQIAPQEQLFRQA